mmetsp:Transcript_1791/g.2500  ORF Transcript_1791/g.2500 Transcript_1791/m.2500 type:complete len:354 (+) Transcript_1791:173-1234(+)
MSLLPKENINLEQQTESLASFCYPPWMNFPLLAQPPPPPSTNNITNREDQEQNQSRSNLDPWKASSPPNFVTPSHALTLSIHLSKSPIVTPSIQHAAVRSLLSHILYTRGVIPCPTSQLLTTLETSSRERKEHECQGWSKRVHTQATKCASQYHQMLQDVLTIFTSVKVKRVLITLGPSFVHPKEQYVLLFPTSPVVTQTATTPLVENKEIPLQRMEQELTRRLVRSYLQSIETSLKNQKMFEIPRKKQSTQKVQIAMFVVNSQNKSSPQTKENHCSHEQTLFSTKLSSRIVVRPTFEICIPKLLSKKQNVHRPFMVVSYHAAEESEVVIKRESSSQEVWISLRSTLKGFRMK